MEKQKASVQYMDWSEDFRNKLHAVLPVIFNKWRNIFNGKFLGDYFFIPVKDIDHWCGLNVIIKNKKGFSVGIPAIDPYQAVIFDIFCPFLFIAGGTDSKHFNAFAFCFFVICFKLGCCFLAMSAVWLPEVEYGKVLFDIIERNKCPLI